MPRIRVAELQSRLERCAAAMRRNGIDCFLLLPGATFAYYTGLSFARERYRLVAALIAADGSVVLFGPVFEERKLGACPVRTAVETWRDEEDQMGRVARAVERIAGRAARLAVDQTANHHHVLALGAALPGAALVDATPVAERLRAVKSPAEIECLRAACLKTRERLAAVPALLVPGMTERELGEMLGGSAMVQFGLTTSLPNEPTGSRALAHGDAVVIDAGDRVEGYRSDLARTFCCGEPPPRLVEVFAVVDAAARAAIAAVRPGAPAEVVDLAAREVIARAGFGEHFTHRGGHGIGLDFHELPLCVQGNTAPLEPGMVIAVEPGIYIPGELGVRIEDDVLVTESGCELLAPRGPLLERGSSG